MNMLRKLKKIYQYISLMGFDWFIFRIKYEILKRINYFNKINKSILFQVNSVDNKLFNYKRVSLVNKEFKADSSFLEKADNAINSRIYAFSNEYLDYAHDGKIDWHMNPMNKLKADDGLPWNNLPDFDEYGDIKLIWEVSRFPQVYYFINAYSITKDRKYADVCILQIMDWIESNPYPLGVNYKCGQEISFRIFAWIQALEYFSDFISVKNEAAIVKNIYTSLLRIESNIEYALRSVKNNHSISEAAGLFVGGLLFSQFEESERFVAKGLSLLLSETAYQVNDDGSYIQNSFMYERLVLDILSFIILIAKKKSFTLPDEIERRHQKMIVFLYSFVQKNGWLPNYGSNDGSKLFLLDPEDYRDFRNSLNFAMAVKKSESIYENYDDLASFFNLTIDQKVLLEKKTRFEQGGYYVLKNNNLFSFIRCHSYIDRPAQNDMFHLDIWYKGKNIFCDTGSYSYNTNDDFKNNFIGNIGHNTLLVNDRNFMERVLNFGWSNWTKSRLVKHSENIFEGMHYGYQKQFGIICFRRVVLEKNNIKITDKITADNNNNIEAIQLWHTKESVKYINEYTVKVGSCILKSNFPLHIEKSYISDYYNSYTKGTKVLVKAESKLGLEIHTEMEFME